MILWVHANVHLTQYLFPTVTMKWHNFS